MTNFVWILVCLALHITHITVAPLPEPILKTRNPQDGSTYTCPNQAGTAAKKKQLIGAGATPEDVGLAMYETSCGLSGSSYKFRDGKSGFSANYGPYKNNCYNIQQSCGDLNPALRGGEANCDSAKILNDDANYGLATECLHRQQNSVDPKTGKSFEETQRCGVGMACPDAGQYNSGVKEVGQYFEKGSKGRFDGSAISASHPVQPH